MNLKFIAILLLLQNVICAQKDSKFGVPYSYCNWSNTSLNKNYNPTINDTCLFVISTRNYDENKHEFVDYDYDTTGTLKYFAVYFNHNQWIAVPYASLTELLNIKKEFQNLVVFTEGLGKTFTSGMDRATQLMRLYNVDELFFDWPTERPYLKPGKNIKATCILAPIVSKNFAQFIEEFQKYKIERAEKFKTTTLLNHSMGNLLLMYDLQNDYLKNIHLNLFDNVIINAACVNQKNHKTWLDKLSFSKNCYLTINDKDRNLRGARILFKARQLGESPQAEFCKNVNYVDFSEVLSIEHNYFLMQKLLIQKPYLKKFYADIFEGKIPQLKFTDMSIPDAVKKYLPAQSDNGI
jgi:hypothetical protein